MYACIHAEGNPLLLVECARHFSPLIEETSPDTVLFDVRGLGSLIGDLEDIAQAIANRAGIPVNIALSADPDAAAIAARGIRGITVIPPGREAAVLAPLPLNLLPAGSPETAELLDAWGIRTLGELAALPPLGIAARLGNEGTYLQQLAQGNAGRQIHPLEDALRFEEEMELEHPVDLLEPLSFLLSRMLNDLCLRLMFHALSTDEIRLTLVLENTEPHRCALRLPVPMRDVKTLLKLLQLELSARPPGAPILKIRIELNPVKPRTQQHGLFLALAPEPAKLEVTLSRLSNLLGKENVGTPELLDTHRPDSFRMNRFAAVHARHAEDAQAKATLVLRRYRPPKYAQVRLLNEIPVYIATGSIQSKVLAHAGPWRSSGDWWKPEPWDHAEWDIALANGALYRIHEDLRTGRWFLEGELRLSANYIELHARSAFSFLEGASLPEEYADVAAKLELPAMALLDRDGFYGSPRFFSSMKKQGLRGHTGAEVLCTDGSRYPLLAKNRQGYQNLCRLLTRTKLRTEKHPKPGREAAAAPEEIAEFAAGLLCLTGDGDGPLAHAIRRGQGRECLDFLLRTFGRGNVYAELQRHYDRDEEARNQAVVSLARGMQIPLVATNGVYHTHPAQRQILDVFTCLHHKVKLSEAGRLLAKNAERHLKSGAEMARLFADYPEAIANTFEISAQLGFELSDLGYEFPHYPVPYGQTEMEYLRDRTRESARMRYQSGYKRARPQIERELDIIEKLKLAGYFLIVWDIVNFCRDEGILVQGRGSAANSAVCYSLGITAVDPIGMELLFERFLSEERGEWPDIDLDLPSGEKRERVIQHVYKRYGKLGAAMTANVITYRGRSAAREVGKVLGFETTTLDRVSGLIPMWGWKDPDDTTKKQFAEAGLDLSHPRIRKFLDLVEGIQDMPRHLGQHSGGMVICQGQLDSVVPLEPASMPDRVVVQWDKEDCADLGLIKVDLLGLGMMAVLEESLVLIRRHYKRELDLGQLPPDDPETYKTLQNADTIGMFQVESRAQQASLPRMKPVTFYDIVVQVAIIRPGPIVGKMMHPYLARRQGKEAPDCLHPCLEPVLRRTLGVPLFQEQLLRIAMVAASFTGGEAEELRRAMGFKRSQERMKTIEVRLREGMTRNGITGETQDTIVQSITAFALYGFPESHAASFALLAYASAFLKVHFLAAFTCALLNNQPMGFYHPAVLIKDAQRHGLRVLPIDVTRSEWDCTLEEKHLRLGLRYVKGLRAESAVALLEQRKIAPFADIDDLARRVPRLNKDEISKMAAAGALNPLSAEHRRDALWKASRAAQHSGPLLIEVPENDPAAPLRPMTTEERLDADYRGTGVNIGLHPMAHRRAEMDALGVTPAAELAGIPSGKPVRIAGCVIVRQRPGTAKGIVFLSVEDETGVANVVVMPDMFDENRMTIIGNRWLMVEGPIQNVDNVIHVRARKFEPLGYAMASVASHDFH